MAIDDIRHVFDELEEDAWRKDHPFNPDILDAHKVMHHPFARTDEINEVLRAWCLKRQPCNFGRIAAKYGNVHFCIITERDLLGDKALLKAKLAEEKRLWKQRALSELKNPPHAFMLVISSPRVAFAAPNGALKRFATCIRDLAGFKPTSGGGAEASDYLYLPNPADRLYYGFKFNLDFFAVAGDGRWWHDHRIPGGIAFTANSTGHMRHWQEWYSPEKGTDRSEFFVKNAMYTIAQAHPTAAAVINDGSMPFDPIAEGRVTWLRDLGLDNRPRKNSECPFKDGVPKRLQGKDWTTYEGLLHTDHNVRDEFFVNSARPPACSRPYLMDFTYLYETRERDFIDFVAGIRKSEGEVFAEIGDPKEWRVAGAPGVRHEEANIVPRTPEEAAEVRRLLAVCERWSDSPDLISEAAL
ncbi:MAG: hypothetical protein HUU21_18725 [Polyangiaceae bacterium]|nr:hypothetical protein [Polyangiaceae bacterium]